MLTTYTQILLKKTRKKQIWKKTKQMKERYLEIR